MTRHHLPRGVAACVRVCLAVLILAWLFSRMPREELMAAVGTSLRHWPWWVAGILYTFLGLTAGSFRWQVILRAKGFRLAWTRVFRIFFIGQFFNAFFLGACGGDLARAYYATQETPEHKTAAALTVLVDRAIGLLVFAVFGCLMILMRGRHVLDRKEEWLPGLLMGAFILATLVGLILLFRRNLFETRPFFQRLEKLTRLGPALRQVYDVLFFYRTHRRVLLISTGLSLFNLAFLTLACRALGQSLEIRASLVDYFTLFPVITVFSALLAITPGALGVRESLFVSMFAPLGVAEVSAFSLSLLVYLGGVAWSLFGGLLFLAGSSGSGHRLREEMDELRAEKETLVKTITE